MSGKRLSQTALREMGISEEQISAQVRSELHAAARDVVLQEGRHRVPGLSVVPTPAVARLRNALERSDR